MPAQIIPGIFYKGQSPQQQELQDQQNGQLLNFITALHNQHNNDALVAAQLRASQREDQLSQALFDSKVREQNSLAQEAEARATGAQQVTQKNAFDLSHQQDTYNLGKQKVQAEIGASTAEQNRANVDSTAIQGREDREALHYKLSEPIRIARDAIGLGMDTSTARTEASKATVADLQAKQAQEEVDRNHLLTMMAFYKDKPNGDALMVADAKKQGLYGTGAWKQALVAHTGFEEDPYVNSAVQSGDADQISAAAYKIAKEAQLKSGGSAGVTTVDPNYLDSLKKQLTMAAQKFHTNRLRTAFQPDTPVQVMQAGKIVPGKIVSNDGIAHATAPHVAVNLGDDANPNVQQIPLQAVQPITDQQATQLQQNRQQRYADMAKRMPEVPGVGADGRVYKFQWSKDASGNYGLMNTGQIFIDQNQASAQPSQQQQQPAVAQQPAATPKSDDPNAPEDVPDPVMKD